VARPLDTPIPADEPLYRGLRPEWLKGQSILPEAVDLQGMSVNRHKYDSNPRNAMSAERGETAVGTTCVKDLPGALVMESGVSYVFKVDDAPTEPNSAHAEIRPYRSGKEWDPKHKISSANRIIIKMALAKTMVLVPLTD
jgi:hypothetical protein